MSNISNGAQKLPNNLVQPFFFPLIMQKWTRTRTRNYSRKKCRGSLRRVGNRREGRFLCRGASGGRPNLSRDQEFRLISWMHRRWGWARPLPPVSLGSIDDKSRVKYLCVRSGGCDTHNAVVYNMRTNYLLIACYLACLTSKEVFVLNRPGFCHVLNNATVMRPRRRGRRGKSKAIVIICGNSTGRVKRSR